MVGHPYDGGALRLGATVDGETINLTDDDIYLALMDSTYVQHVETKADDAINGHEHWSDISTHGIVSGISHPAGGVQLTMVDPYIEATMYAPFRYLVYTANAAATPFAYSVQFNDLTFTNITGAVIYKKDSTPETSPLFTFISELTNRAANGGKYWIKFGNPGETLGFYAVLLGMPAPE